MLIFVSGIPPDERGEKLHFVEEKCNAKSIYTVYHTTVDTSQTGMYVHVYICSDSSMFICCWKIFIYEMHKSTTNLRPLVPSHSSKCTCIAVRPYVHLFYKGASS